MQVDRKHLTKALRIAGEQSGGLVYLAEQIWADRLPILSYVWGDALNDESVRRIAVSFYRAYPDLAPSGWTPPPDFKPPAPQVQAPRRELRPTPTRPVETVLRELVEAGQLLDARIGKGPNDGTDETRARFVRALHAAEAALGQEK